MTTSLPVRRVAPLSAMRPVVCALGLVCVLMAALGSLSSDAATAPTATVTAPRHYGRSVRSSRSASISLPPRAFRTLGTSAANEAAVAEYCSRATVDISIPNVLSLSRLIADTASPLSVPCDPRSFAFNVAPETRAAGISVDIPGGDRQASNAWVEVSNGGRGYTEEAQNPTMYVDLDGVRDIRFTAGGAYIGSIDCRADPDVDQDSAYCGYCAVGPIVVQCVDPTLGFASQPALVASAIEGAAVASSSSCSTCVTVGSAQACDSGVALEWRLLPAADPSLTDNAFCGPFGAPPCTSLYERWFDAFDVQIFGSTASSQAPALLLTLPAVKAREDGTARLEIRGGAMILISASGSTAVTTGDPSDFIGDGSRQFTVRLFNPVTQRTSDASAAASYRVETVCTQPAISSSTGTSGPPPPPPPPVGEFEESSTAQDQPVLPSSTAAVVPRPPSSTGAGGSDPSGPSGSAAPSAGGMETGDSTGGLPVPVEPTLPANPSTGGAGEQQSSAPPPVAPPALSSSAVAAPPPSGSLEVSSSGLAPVNDASAGAPFAHASATLGFSFAFAIAFMAL